MDDLNTQEEAGRDGWKHLHLSTRNGQIDLLGEILGIGAFNQCLARSVPINLGGKEFRILSLEAMIQAKRAIGCPIVAIALGHSIATQADSVEKQQEMTRDAVRCHFGDSRPGPMLQIIRLHFVRDEALAV